MSFRAWVQNLCQGFMGAASAKPAPCRLLMAGCVPGDDLRVCLNGLGRPEILDCRTGESCTQGGYVTHSMMRLPSAGPHLLRLRKHGLDIDAVASLEAKPAWESQGASPYSGLIFVVDAGAAVRRGSGVLSRADDARKMLAAFVDELGRDRPPASVAVIVINCAGQAVDVIRSSITEYLNLGELVGVSARIFPAPDDGRVELYEALEWLGTQIKQGRSK